MNTPKPPFAELLDRAFLAWLNKIKRGRGTQNEFSVWLGFSKTTVSNWMNGVFIPTDRERAKRLADRLATLEESYRTETYVALGLPPDDARLITMIEGWAALGEVERNEVAAAYERIAHRAAGSPHRRAGQRSAADEDGREHATVEDHRSVGDDERV